MTDIPHLPEPEDPEPVEVDPNTKEGETLDDDGTPGAAPPADWQPGERHVGGWASPVY